MEREISKPNIVKNIPVPLIRPLPTLYYYGRYASENGPIAAHELFKNSVAYLSAALDILKAEIDDSQLDEINSSVTTLTTTPREKLIDEVIQITTNLSSRCTAHKAQLRDNPKLSKQNFLKLYKQKVQPIKILLIDNNNEPQRITKLYDTFYNTCYYEVLTSTLRATNFADKVNESDFIIFTSAYPITINEDVQNIQTYRKPCLIMADLKKEKKFDQQTIRNGAWLQRKGYDVLYKIFTPLRLFTTIDKNYMKFQFNE